MELPKLDNIRLNGGDISIQPVTGRIPQASYIYLIIGPTGSGKSSFIEALTGETQHLLISKDQLEGYTQNVNVYRVINVSRHKRQLYLVDTPGFSDSKISEVEIIKMIRKRLKDKGAKYVDKILYLIPISETRLPRSRRRTIQMLKQLLEPKYAQREVTFITTMWDMLHSEHSQTRAESNFAQLRDHDFFATYPVSITRFMNTKNSALEALDEYKVDLIDSFFNTTASASAHLYQDLHERVECALQVKQMIESDLAQPDAKVNSDLSTILARNQRENHETLTKFIQQFVDFHPIPAEFGIAAQHLRKSIIASTTPPTLKYKILYWQWEHELEMSEDAAHLSVPSQKLSLRGLLLPLIHSLKYRGAHSPK
ncbi:P-loop containing nucleoside triphosphate hydrolase protein [Panaeolus papilionaceus]|nr:P-loop containing nucleoside triphosphate hydrolase protein [Panaeolus papilionaceus]